MMRSNFRRNLLLICLALVLTNAACSHNKEAKKTKGQKARTGTVYARDWNRFPAVIERDTSSEVVAIGDVHGGYDRLVNLFSTAGLIKPDRQSPAGYSWVGGNRVLVSVGDLIDKGDKSIEVLDLMISLEAQAPASGGAVIVTLGNHEAEFLADPNKKKSREFTDELQSKGIDPEMLVQGQKPYGEWLMNRPLAARVNDWFFSHAGNTSGKTIDEIATRFQHVVNEGDWGSNFLIGDDSLIEAEKWWKHNGNPRELLTSYLTALKVGHIVFGHDPGAFHKKGEIGQEEDGEIFLIDVGMSPAVDYSSGALMLIDKEGPEVVATALDSNGIKRQLWRGAISEPRR